ncbi:MAG: hypothetical protein QXJ23_10665 [Thermofilum sp.]|uniref:hypothetical protein n=1 Tax=Thermofilum sp. TaxID=1961369 RepID=UPI003180F400
MSTLTYFLGSAAIGTVLGLVRGMKGNAPIVAESAASMAIFSTLAYLVDEPWVYDLFKGAVASSAAIFGTEITNQAQTAKQLWKPVSQPVMAYG